MPVLVNTKQHEFKNSSELAPRSPAAASRTRKAPGTRVGTAEDWRSGYTKGTHNKSERGKGLRDGR